MFEETPKITVKIDYLNAPKTSAGIPSQRNSKNLEIFSSLALNLDDSINKTLSNRSSRQVNLLSSSSNDLDKLINLKNLSKKTDTIEDPLQLIQDNEMQLCNSSAHPKVFSLKSKGNYSKNRLDLWKTEEIKLISIYNNRKIASGNVHPTCFAVASHILLVGYSNSSFTVFTHTGDIVYETKPAKNYGKVMSADISFTEKESVVGYENGVVSIWSLKRRSLIKNLKNLHSQPISMLKLWKNPFEFIISADSSGKMIISQYKKKVLKSQISSFELLSSEIGSILAVELLETQEIIGIHSIIAAVGSSKISIILIEPKIQVIFIIERTEDRPDMDFPCVKWQVRSKPTPLLTLLIAWGEIIFIYTYNGDESEPFELSSSIKFESSVLNLFCIDTELILIYNDLNEFCVVKYSDLNRNEEQDTINWKDKCIRKINIKGEIVRQNALKSNFANISTFFGSVCYARGAFFVLGKSGVWRYRLIGWEECIETLRGKQDWLGCFSLGIQFFHGKYNVIYKTKDMTDHIKNKLVHLIKEYSKMAGVPLEHRISNSIEVCIEIHTMDLLFIELFESFMTENYEVSARAMVKELEWYIITRQLSELPLTIINRFIEYYQKIKNIERFESLIVHLDPLNLNSSALMTICEELRLTTAYLYISTNSNLHDFISPVKFLYKLLKKSANESESLYLLYKILWYIELCIKGKKFPTGFIEDSLHSQIIPSLITWMLKNNHMILALSLDCIQCLNTYYQLFLTPATFSHISPYYSDFISNLLKSFESHTFAYQQICLFTLTTYAKFQLSLPHTTISGILEFIIAAKPPTRQSATISTTINEFIFNKLLSPSRGRFANHSTEELDSLLSKSLKKLGDLIKPIAETLYKISQFSPYTKVMIFLLELQGKIRECIEHFLSLSEIKMKQRVFGWIRKTYNKFEQVDKDRLLKNVFNYLTELSKVSMVETEGMIKEYFADQIIFVISSINDAPLLQYKLISELDCSELPDDIIVRYVEILCEYYPLVSILFLKMLNEYTSEAVLSRCYEVCMRFNLIDPACYILARQNRAKEAYTLLYRRLERTKLTIESKISYQLILNFSADIEKILHLCESNSDDFIPTEFEGLFTSILFLSISLYNKFQSFATDLLSIIQMIIVSSVNFVKIEFLIMKISEEFKSVPLKVFRGSVLEIMRVKAVNLINLRKGIDGLNRDVEGLSKELFQKGLKGVVQSEGRCFGCGMEFEGSGKVKIFMCRHRFHSDCGLKNSCRVCNIEMQQRLSLFMEIIKK